MIAAFPVEIQISSGEWIHSILKKLSDAEDGSTFVVPTKMHLHAFYIAVESLATNKRIQVSLKSPNEFYDEPKSTNSQVG